MTILPANGKFSLKNDGKLEVFFLGVGSAFAKTLFQTNFLLVQGNTHVLVDFGMTGPQALYETTGHEMSDIEVVLPTHSHADHVGGLESLALANRYIARRIMNKPKLKMIINEDYERVLWDMTLRGGLEWNEMDSEGRRLGFLDYFEPIRPTWKAGQSRETFEVTIGDIHIELFRTKHVPEQATSWQNSFISYGLYVNNRVFFSADTQLDLALLYTYADRSEVMFHDVQFFSGAVHTPLSDLQTLPEDIRKKMYLIHYSDNWQQHSADGFAGYAQQGHRYILD
jgi:ribonuclease BN (tRNA processing enzyme)